MTLSAEGRQNRFTHSLHISLPIYPKNGIVFGMVESPEKHQILGGRVYVYRRERSRYWQCSTCLKGRNYRKSTREDSLARAKDFAEDWFFELRGKARTGELNSERTFKEAAERFKREYAVITEGDRNAGYVANTMARLDNYLIPFLGDKGVSEISGGVVQEYRIWRQSYSAPRYRGGELKPLPEPKRPSASTLHQEIVALRQVLKTAIRHGWLDRLPDLSAPYRKSTKVSHRAWFSPDEYKQLYTATRARIAKARSNHRWSAEQLHDYVLFMANTGLRPDEAKNLQHQDVEVVEDEDTEETILVIAVRGKRGVGYCKSMPGAVRPYERLVERNTPEPTDPLFPISLHTGLNSVLEQEGLKFDREGQRRTAYSLRHTYICLRLMEGADIYQIAKNCRTSVEMIEKYYASHIANSIDTAAVNVRKKRKPKAQSAEEIAEDEL